MENTYKMKPDRKFEVRLSRKSIYGTIYLWNGLFMEPYRQTKPCWQRDARQRDLRDLRERDREIYEREAERWVVERLSCEW